MKRITGIKTRFYEDGDWIIEVVMAKDSWEVFLMEKDRYTKISIYGEPRDDVWQTDFDYFMELALMELDEAKEKYRQIVEEIE